MLGTGTWVDGLACTPGTGLHVSVAAGAIYALIQTDATSYGSLGTDSRSLMKQGLSLNPTVLACPAPTTAGQSINYLVEVQYQDVDGGSTLQPYYDSANPTVPYSGPANDGIAQNTLRQGVLAIQIKAGTPATTGTQTTPAADSGWTGLYSVTVAYGASSIVTGNISVISGAPFITRKLGSAPTLTLNEVAISATGAFSQAIPANALPFGFARAIGAGAGAGGSGASKCGGGGGAGEFREGVITITPGGNVTGTIGSGGAGGASGAAGSAGGATTIGSITANGGTGGNGGTPDVAGGAGGTGGSGGTVAVPGGQGVDGSATTNTAPWACGGASFLGGGPRATAGAPVAAVTPGTGGGAAYNASATGGAGAPGYAILQYWTY